MPFGDGTGPTGMGPMTGRAAGFCAGNAVPGYASAGGRGGRGFFGRGGGRGGGGRGWRNRFFATGLTGWQRAAMGWPGAVGVMPPVAGVAPVAMSQEQQFDALKNQAEYFQGALDDTRKRIEELQGKQDKA